jgi:hypothetical protein
MYIANLSDWVVEDTSRVRELQHELSLMTVTDREAMYTHKEICKVLEVGEFLKALGYPTQAEASHIVSDSNVVNVPHSTADVKHFFMCTECKYS